MMFKSIAVFRLSALGDVLMYVPTIRALQDAFPMAKIYWIISQPAYELVRNIPEIEFIVIQKPRSLFDYWRLKRLFKAYNFDVLLASQANFRTNLIYPCIRAKQKIGYDAVRSRDGHCWFVDETIPSKQVHTLESFLQFAEYLGANTAKVRWDIPINSTVQAWVDQFLLQHKKFAGPWIVINPVASKPERSWVLEGYVQLIMELQQRYQANVILSGGPGEHDRYFADTILKTCQVIDLVGKTQLQQLFALIATVDLLICPDTGPAHMAAAVGTPVVALHAVTRPEISGPYGQLQNVVNQYENARVQFGDREVSQAQDQWFKKVHHPGAMQLIKVEHVLKKVAMILSHPIDLDLKLDSELNSVK